MPVINKLLKNIFFILGCALVLSACGGGGGGGDSSDNSSNADNSNNGSNNNTSDAEEDLSTSAVAGSLNDTVLNDVTELADIPDPVVDLGDDTGQGDTVVVLESESLEVLKFYDYEGQEIPSYIAQQDDGSGIAQFATGADGEPDKDNTGDNPVTNEAATLGRVLFYDVNLSVDNSRSCASCHQQEFAFSDPDTPSAGTDLSGGVTGRSSTRLVNLRFNEESNFFWDERADTLEQQATMPIRDAVEMGFHGCDIAANQDDCDPNLADFDDLIAKMEALDYYPELFELAFGTSSITEERMQLAMAQFQRTFFSFDTKYDMALADYIANVDPDYEVPALLLNSTEDDPAFPLLTDEENFGKALYMSLTQFETKELSEARLGDAYDPENDLHTGLRVNELDGSGNLTSTPSGLSCHGCHIAPEFDIDIVETNCALRDSGATDCNDTRKKNNGVIGVAGDETGLEVDLNNTRSPSIRDLGHFDTEGNYVLNGAMFHDGSAETLEEMLEHYNSQITSVTADALGVDENGDAISPQAGNAKIDSRIVGIPNLVGIDLTDLTNWAGGQRLDMTDEEMDAMVAFLKTLTGTDMYTNPRWSDPFNSDGSLNYVALGEYSIDVADPANGESYMVGESIEFAFYTEALTVSSVNWSSDIDGDLGSAETFQASLSAGTHEITVIVETDSGEVQETFSISVIAPNILFILADDMGAESSSLYPELAGDTEQVSMPNIESLAETGLVFDSVWSSPVCTPTRATIISGQYGNRSGVVTNTNLRASDITSIFDYVGGSSPQDYAMGVYGKWDTGDHANYFDSDVDIEFRGLADNFTEDYFEWEKREFIDGAEVVYDNADDAIVTTYSTTALTDYAVEFIEEQEAADKPWFVYLPYNAPHGTTEALGFQVPPADLHSVDVGSLAPGDIEDSIEIYQAMIQAMDTEIGRLLESVDLTETLVIFMGDNGTPGRAVQADNTGIDGVKSNIQEGGIWVPMVMSGAGVSRVNEREDDVVVSTDIYATIAAAAGIGVEEIEDSHSLLPLLSDNSASSGREYAFTELCNASGDNFAYAIRDQQYKLSYDNGVWGLYDLVNDLAEETNLFDDADYAEIQSALQAELDVIEANSVSGCFE